MLELRSGRPHVLVVDDEREIRNLLCELLSEGYDCTPV
ncbi:MAG: DNA-binding response regulator, partial [Acidobacteria bacterium]